VPDASTRHGAGRALIAVYGVLAVAATSRALYELATKFGDAPLPYSLSAVAAVVYIVITVALVRGTPRARRVATVCMVAELVGVLVVGTWSAVDPAAFPKSSVWFLYGRDYLLVPLVLPILGLWFLRRSRPEPGQQI
jgi:hypothetical protein